MPRTRVLSTSQRQMKSLEAAAECLRVLAHPHRLRIVQILLGDEAYTVNELATACGITQPMTSDHLRLMQRCGFLSKQKAGRHVHYRIAEPHLASIMQCVEDRFG